MIEKDQALEIANDFSKISEVAHNLAPPHEPELRTAESIQNIFGDGDSEEFKNVRATFKPHWVVTYPFLKPDNNHVVDAIYVIVDAESGAPEFFSQG